MIRKNTIVAPTRRIFILAVAILATLWVVIAGAGPASAASDLGGPDANAITNYCKSLPGGTGAAVVSPGNAYSYRCHVNGRLTLINMRDLCQKENPAVPKDLVYDRVDLTRFDHPNGANTGWDCFMREKPLVTGGVHTGNPFQLTKSLIGKSCLYGATLVSPGHANDWQCLTSDGKPDGTMILMDTACSSAAGSIRRGYIGWVDRVTNFYDPYSVLCYY